MNQERHYAILDLNLFNAEERKALTEQAETVVKGNQIVKDRSNGCHVEGNHFSIRIDQPVKPQLPLVPPGPNKTRKGDPARVIVNDRSCDGTFGQVIALILNHDGITERISYCDQQGRTSTSANNDDLVGHLPPEKPKPREVWIRHLSANSIDWNLQKCSDLAYKLFREVIE